MHAASSSGACVSKKFSSACLFQELGQRHIFSAPLVIKPDLEDAVYGAEDRPEPTLLGWIDVTTILQAFLKGVE